MGYKRFLLVETIDKLVNIDRFNMIQCERYFQAKIGLSTNDHIGGWNHRQTSKQRPVHHDKMCQIFPS